MFNRLLFGRKNKPVTLEAFLERSLYEKFRDYMVQNRLDESSALVKILERGMANYWLHEYKEMKKRYLNLKKLFEEYRKDNELLNALQRENDRLRRILEKRGLKE